MRWRKAREPFGLGDEPVAAFWDWWLTAGASQATRLVSGGGMGGLPEEIGRLVDAINPGLTWEVGPGTVAAHALVVTGGGVAEPRRDAERWFRAAPVSGTAWEYHPSRQPNPRALQDRLRFAGIDLDLSAFRFATTIDDPRAVLDIAIFHPLFGRLSLDEKQHVQFLVLDQLLGEDEVVRWIGVIDIVDANPPDSVDGAGLRRSVAGLAERTKPTTRLISGQRDGHRFVAFLAHPLKWIDHLLLDTRVSIVLPYPDQDAAGLPTELSSGRISEFQGNLRSSLGARGHLTTRRVMNGAAALHLYIDQTDTQARHAVDTAAATWPGSTVTARPDPAWERAENL